MAGETAKDRKHLFLLGYAERGDAEAALAALKGLGRDHFVEVSDNAIITKEVGGKLSVVEDRHADPGAVRGGLAGGAAGLVIAALSFPIGGAAIAVGAGVGAVTAALRDSGFQRNDLDEVGRLMQDGRSILLVAVDETQAARMQAATEDLPELRKADRRLDMALAADSRQLLRDAIDRYKADEARHPDELEPLA